MYIDLGIPQSPIYVELVQPAGSMALAIITEKSWRNEFPMTIDLSDICFILYNMSSTWRTLRSLPFIPSEFYTYNPKLAIVLATVVQSLHVISHSRLVSRAGEEEGAQSPSMEPLPPSTDVIQYWYRRKGGRRECGWRWLSTSTDGWQGSMERLLWMKTGMCVCRKRGGSSMLDYVHTYVSVHTLHVRVKMSAVVLHSCTSWVKPCTCVAPKIITDASFLHPSSVWLSTHHKLTQKLLLLSEFALH